jgi:hypothetical protein
MMLLDKLGGNTCFYDKDLRPCRSRLLLSRLDVVPGNLLAGGFWELCRKILAGSQLPLFALPN